MKSTPALALHHFQNADLRILTNLDKQPYEHNHACSHSKIDNLHTYGHTANPISQSETHTRPATAAPPHLHALPLPYDPRAHGNPAGFRERSRKTRKMAEAYERERQNNSRLDELASKVTALRGVTIDIYDNARDQGVIDNANETFSSFSTTLKGSATRLGRMAQSGNKVAILKLAGIIVGSVVVLYWIWSLVF